MKVQSKKQKGRLGQYEIVRRLYAEFPYLEEGDIRSTSMGAQGHDVQLSPKAQKVIPCAIEVKRGRAFNLIKACKQAEEYSKWEQPVSMGRYDHDKQWYVCLHLEYFLKLLKGETDI